MEVAALFCLFYVFYSLWKHVLWANLCALFGCREMSERFQLPCRCVSITVFLVLSGLFYHCTPPEQLILFIALYHTGMTSVWSLWGPITMHTLRFPIKPVLLCSSRVTLTNISLQPHLRFSPCSASLALVFREIWVSFSRCQHRVIGFSSAMPCQQT